MRKIFFGLSLSASLSALSLLSPLLFALSVPAHAAQRELQKLTVGYTPVSGAALPFFITIEEKLFQKHGLEISPVFMGGSPLINSAILAGEFPIGYTGGGAVLPSGVDGGLQGGVGHGTASPERGAALIGPAARGGNRP